MSELRRALVAAMIEIPTDNAPITHDHLRRMFVQALRSLDVPVATAEKVKLLRKRTGSSMRDSALVLEEADGDVAKAEDLLYERYLAPLPRPTEPLQHDPVERKATYGDAHGHPGCHGCQICWGNDPAVQAALDDPDLGKGDPLVDAEAAAAARTTDDIEMERLAREAFKTIAVVDGDFEEHPVIEGRDDIMAFARHICDAERVRCVAVVNREIGFSGEEGQYALRNALEGIESKSKVGKRS